jgi:Tol biopolymer transport system component
VRGLQSTLVTAVALGLLAGSAVTVAAQEGEVAAPSRALGESLVVYNGPVGGGSGIRLVTTRGSDDRAAFEGLTPGEQWHPDWSPDGRSIAFAADDTDGTRDLWMGSVDGSSAERIYDCAAPCGWTDDPAWSPDGGSILFQRGSAVDDAGMGVGTVDVIDLESRTVTTLATGAETEYFYVPRWAPDMSAVVVELDRFDSGRLDASVVVSATLAVVDLGGATPAVRELLPVDRRAVYPDWGATGKIVFQAPLDPASPDGPSDLYTIDPAGGDATRVTMVGDDGRQALQPTWAPDGSRIIFVEQDGPFANVRMSTINPDGTDLGSATAPVDIFGTHPRLQPGEAATGS